MAKKRLPMISAETADEFKRKVSLAFPGETGAYGRELEIALKRHQRSLDKRAQKLNKSK